MLRPTRALPLRAASCVRAVHQPTPLLRASFALATTASATSRITVHRRTFHATTISANTNTTATTSSTPPSAGSVDTQTLAKAETAAAAAAPAADGAVPKPTLLERLKKFAEKNQIKWINFGLAGGLTYGIYSLYSASFSLVDFFLDHRPDDAPFLAFFLGCGTTVLAIGAYKLGRRVFVLRPGRMYREALKVAMANDAVRAQLGEDVRAVTLQRMARSIKSPSAGSPSAPASTISSSSPPPSLHFRSASFLPASLRYRPSKESWSRYWQPRRLQVQVWLEGSRGGGLMQAEVEQTLRAEWDEVNVCTVDLVGKGEQIVVKAHYDTRKRHTGDMASVREEKQGFSEERDLLSKEAKKR